MEKYILAPRPTEEALTNMIERELHFPNGRIMKLTMSEWHWAMVAFCDLWNDYFNREAGLLYEFHKMIPTAVDRVFANSVMMHLRDTYNEWIEGDPDVDPGFPDPRA